MDADWATHSTSAKQFGKTGLQFAAHQLFGTLGIDIFAGFVAAYVTDLMHLVGRPVPTKTLLWVLTGTPFYPVQISVALTLGYLISRHTKQRVMLWVWVLPLAYLIYALIAIPTLVPHWIPPAYQAGVGESRFRHYFGWGCGPHPCFDQNAITVLFYIAASYSIGALLARKMPDDNRRQRGIRFWGLIAMGAMFLVAGSYEVTLALHRGWRWVYLSVIGVALGTGVYLILFAIALRRKSTTILPETGRQIEDGAAPGS
jgi:hypothetical protein